MSQEPSIEEILSSIRQIISDDEGGETQQAEAPPPAPEVPAPAPSAPPPVDDVIELTQKVEDPAPDFARMVESLIEVEMKEAELSEPEPELESKSEPENMPEITPEPVVEMSPEPVVETVSELEPEPEYKPEPVMTPPPPPPLSETPPAPAPAPAPVAENEGILSKAVEEVAFHAFAEIARKTAVEHSGVTLEEIVRSELKPMLRDWLDRYLPIIIERLVQDELERVAKRAMEE